MTNTRAMLVAAPLNLALVLVPVLALGGCPPPPNGPRGGGGGGGGGGIGVNPDACGAINTNPVGRKLYSFLVASAELDRSSTELESSVHHACVVMAGHLGVPTGGDTKQVCENVANALNENLKISVKSESHLVTRTTPAVCHTDVSFEAGVIADCEGHASAQPGFADASAECRASASIRATTHTTCTPAKVEVVRENVTIVDDSKFQMAMAAINEGMPELLTAGKKLELAGEALGNWVATGASLLRASGELVGQLGEKGVCVGGQLAAVVGASANIQARFSVSIEVSASVSASAGAK